MNGRLLHQELALREVISTFSRLHQRGNSLGAGPGWFGPASAAYDASLDLLRMELRAAHSRLIEALHDTASAVVAVSASDLSAATSAGESCGG